MTVHLVGAGPGHPDLLTVRAATLLGEADVVVHDRLIDKRVLELAAPWAELIDVGKRPGSRANSQEVINQLLIDRGRRVDCVVRLKGGDPFLFGRGGEEALALQAAGIKVTEVPGITSAIAAPAAAGIPVTMRGTSSGVSVVTGRLEPGGPQEVNWRALANSGTTLVILMGAAIAGTLARRLMEAGMPAETPTAIVHAANTESQQIVRGPLRELGISPIHSPATIVVGDVAAFDVLSQPTHLLLKVSLDDSP